MIMWKVIERIVSDDWLVRIAVSDAEHSALDNFRPSGWSGFYRADWSDTGHHKL